MRTAGRRQKSAMKNLLLIVVAALTVTSASAQSKFAGEYMGIASPVKWGCSERAIIDVFVYTDGSYSVQFVDYDADWSSTTPAVGWLIGKGQIVTSFENGWFVSAKVSASGTVKGKATGPCTYTFTAYRRKQFPYDP